MASAVDRCPPNSAEIPMVDPTPRRVPSAPTGYGGPAIGDEGATSWRTSLTFAPIRNMSCVVVLAQSSIYIGVLRSGTRGVTRPIDRL